MIIQNKIINIFGRPGSGKTFLASFFAYFYFLNKGTIYSNVDFFYKGGQNRINKKIQKITDIKYIEFQKIKGLIIIDEGGLNINSRRSISNQNMEFAEMIFLGRKKNCDIIFLAQLDYSIDKYMRDMANANIFMESYPVGKNYLNFTLKIKKGDYTIGFKEIDLIKFANETGFHYSTLESSKITKEEKIKKEKPILTDGKNIYNNDVLGADVIDLVRSLE